MTDIFSDLTSRPLQLPAPGSRERHFTETLTTPLPLEVVWKEFLRAITDSRQAVLWPTAVSHIRSLSAPIGEGTLLEHTPSTGVHQLHYRIVRFSPPHLIQYASVQGHHLAGGATITLERTGDRTTLRWRIEYAASEAQLAGLDRYCAAFFAGLAQQLRLLEV